MLVLSRKAGQQIHIGDDVVITLTKVTGNRVAVGIEAPLEVSIRRGELEIHNDESESSTVILLRHDDSRPPSSHLAAAQ
ncbi:carbon storage regulator [Rubripirellula reticaptiva]|uniref:Translational regulator CsrA n=1 Tax=Rubripirellula reticaptiva TaxID=2528013 RepID=A0A5C6ESC1_9BACT|nr:carbon storage regulator [Rubripirellula reticaptiva]TWU51254.1 Carbon storage regulator [Rubripirellula reticaptiva]